MLTLVDEVEQVEDEEETAHELLVLLWFFIVDVADQEVDSFDLMVLWVFDDIEDVVAEGLEVVPAAELGGTGLELIVWLLEGEEVAEHVHDGFLGFPFGDVFDALSDPPHFCQLSQVEVVLQLDAHVPGVDQELADDVGGDEVGEGCDDVGA